MVEMSIYGVSFDLIGKQPIVLLKTANGNRYLPIWIGQPEAAAILMKLQRCDGAAAAHPRPARQHSRASSRSRSSGSPSPSCARTPSTPRSRSQQGDAEIEIDSRSSDAIAVAVRAHAPIFAADEVIEESSIEFDGDEVNDEDIVDEFKRFLDRVSAEDFAEARGRGRLLSSVRREEHVGKRDAVERAVHEHAGVDAAGRQRSQASAQPSSGEFGEGLDEAVARGEEEADRDDRDPACRTARRAARSRARGRCSSSTNGSTTATTNQFAA